MATSPGFLREQQPERLKKLSRNSYPGPAILKHEGKLVAQPADLTVSKRTSRRSPSGHGMGPTQLQNSSGRDPEGNCVCAAGD